MKKQVRLYLKSTSIWRIDSCLEITSEQYHYIARVMRLNLGDRFRIFNEMNGEYLVEIYQMNKSCLSIIVKEKIHNLNENNFSQIDLYFAIIKSNKLEILLEKCTELGISNFYPIKTTRTNYKITQKDQVRYKRIITESIEQSERTHPPKLHVVSELKLELFNDYDLVIFGDETGGGEDGLKIIQKQQLNNPKIAILVGPEGGFATEEIAMLLSLIQTKAVTLGPRILRSETAAITLTAITIAISGDWIKKPNN